ncbi:hypothetical protein GCM10009780_40540 [Actinomadura alba]
MAPVLRVALGLALVHVVVVDPVHMAVVHIVHVVVMRHRHVTASRAMGMIMAEVLATAHRA